MRAQGYTQSNGDTTLLFHHGLVEVTILVVYIDDILITEFNGTEAAHLSIALVAEFEIKTLSSLRYFLGLEVAYSSCDICVSQKKYVVDLLKLTGMADCALV